MSFYKLNHYDQNTTTSDQVDIKIVNLIDQEDKDYGVNDDIFMELSILKHLNHPNIIKLYEIDYDQSEQKLGLVLELADNDLDYFIKNVWFERGMRSRKNV